MKLSKEVCERCVSRWAKVTATVCPWGDGAERRWKQGIVWCAPISGSSVAPKAPPDHCEYKAEHWVSQ